MRRSGGQGFTNSFCRPRPSDVTLSQLPKVLGSETDGVGCYFHLDKLQGMWNDRHVREAAWAGSYSCGQSTEGFCPVQPVTTCFGPSSQCCISGDLRWREAARVPQLGEDKVAWRLVGTTAPWLACGPAPSRGGQTEENGKSPWLKSPSRLNSFQI